ncbi:helix-turn-helix domain-containing protein [Streptosporangium soli]|nr:helix-turn-helix domain-containing protein [Streptosporangium sp. KLBMP 9127]
MSTGRHRTPSPNGTTTPDGAVAPDGPVTSGGAVVSGGAAASGGAVTSGGAVVSGGAAAPGGPVTSGGAATSNGGLAGSGVSAGIGAEPSGAPSHAAGSKTIDTGLRLLEILRDHPDGLTITELAQAAGIHRNAVSRHLVALGNHRLVARIGSRFALGLGLVELNAAVRHRLRDAAASALQILADSCNATAFITVLDTDEDQAVVLTVAEPRVSRFHVTYRPGTRHPANRGASGIAILAGRPYWPGERPAIGEARAAGYSVTAGELQTGAWGVAAPITVSGRPAEASVGVVTIGERDATRIAPMVLRTATQIAQVL